MLNISLSGGGLIFLSVVLLWASCPLAALYLALRLNRHPR
jgi:hypothetical protein